MLILQSAKFGRSVNKLHPNQKKLLDKAIRKITLQPKIGQAKVGDLSGVYIYKFKMGNINYLLAYELKGKDEITLLLVGAHENFYKSLKR